MKSSVAESRIQGVIFDLDGTVYLGGRLIPGAAETIHGLRDREIPVLFLSNKPLETPQEYAAKLTRLGISCASHDVLNSTVITTDYLVAHFPAARVYAIGEAPLHNALRRAGIQAATSHQETDIVLISLDRGLTYEKVHFAYHAGVHGALIMATNPDLVCPTDGEAIVDAGAWIAALEALLNRPIDRVLGKPSSLTAEVACKRLGLDAHRVLMVGDRLGTDIRMGRDAGMLTALVLTGVTDAEALARSDVRPDAVLDSIAALPDWLEQTDGGRGG